MYFDICVLLFCPSLSILPKSNDFPACSVFSFFNFFVLVFSVLAVVRCRPVFADHHFNGAQRRLPASQTFLPSKSSLALHQAGFNQVVLTNQLVLTQTIVPLLEFLGLRGPLVLPSVGSSRPSRSSARKIWITYIQAYMPYES